MSEETPSHKVPRTGSLTTEPEVMSPTDKLAYTPEEVAKLLGLHPNSVYQMLKSGELPGVKAGRKWLVSKRRFHGWLDGEDRVIARRQRRTRSGQRQEYSYCPMIWLKSEDGARRQLWAGTFRTKAEAKAEERKRPQERDAGAELAKAILTMNDVFDQYLSEKQTKVKASALQRSKELLQHLRPIFGQSSSLP